MILCDIDGTLIKKLETGNINYDIKTAIPIMHTINAIEYFYQEGHQIVFFTKRDITHYKITRELLDKLFRPEFGILYCKPSYILTNISREAKWDMFIDSKFQSFVGKYGNALLIDDNLEVLHEFNKHGVPAIHPDTFNRN